MVISIILKGATDDSDPVVESGQPTYDILKPEENRVVTTTDQGEEPEVETTEKDEDTEELLVSLTHSMARLDSQNSNIVKALKQNNRYLHRHNSAVSQHIRYRPVLSSELGGRLVVCQLVGCLSCDC